MTVTPFPPFIPPWYLRNGLAMTLYSAWIASRRWENWVKEPEPVYQSHIFIGAEGIPLYGQWAIPEQPQATLVATYGITGDLDNQWFLKLLARKAYAQGFAVVLFDWRGHGKTGELSPTLTADGLYEGEDFVRIAAQAKALGCPAPFWLSGYSLGGQLALWGVRKAATLDRWGPDLSLKSQEIGGGAVICPSVASERSLRYLMAHPVGQYVEKAITKELNKLAWKLHHHHPDDLDPQAIERATSIWGFDEHLVIERLGFTSVSDYYAASSPLPWLSELTKPTLCLYAADDPLFDPGLVTELRELGHNHPYLDIRITEFGGHVGYLSSSGGQRVAQDADPWWAMNRLLAWLIVQTQAKSSTQALVTA
ncbi:MAG: YheT family hydrolase [Microcystaceae cyanobacterium]